MFNMTEHNVEEEGSGHTSVRDVPQPVQAQPFQAQPFQAQLNELRQLRQLERLEFAKISAQQEDRLNTITQDLDPQEVKKRVNFVGQTSRKQPFSYAGSGRNDNSKAKGSRSFE